MRIQTKRLWAVHVRIGRVEKVHSLHNNAASARTTAENGPLADAHDWHGDYRWQEHPGSDLPRLLGLT